MEEYCINKQTKKSKEKRRKNKKEDKKLRYLEKHNWWRNTVAYKKRRIKDEDSEKHKQKSKIKSEN